MKIRVTTTVEVIDGGEVRWSNTEAGYVNNGDNPRFLAADANDLMGRVGTNIVRTMSLRFGDIPGNEEKNAHQGEEAAHASEQGVEGHSSGCAACAAD